MKKVILTIALFLISSIVYLSCKREKKGQNLASEIFGKPTAFISLPVTINAPSYEYATKQLTWIARGLPELARDPIFRWRMKSQLLQTNKWFKKNFELQDFFMLSCAENYDQNTFDIINTDFNNNDYKREYFFGFLLDNCEWHTEIFGKDLKTVDTTLPLVVVPQQDDNEDSDTTIGYYINANTNNLDSIMIDDDNEDDYYIWVVRAGPTCTGTISSLSRACDEDGICESWLGETPQNCSDCSNALNDPDNKALYLVEIRTQDDRKKFSGGWPQSRHQESKYSNNYEMNFTYDIFGSGVDKGNFLWKPTSNGNFEIFGESTPITSLNTRSMLLDIYSATGEDCEVRKTKQKNNGNIVSNGGKNSTITYNTPMSFFYNPYKDNIQFALSEMDPAADCSKCFGFYPLFGPLANNANRIEHFWQMKKRKYTKYPYTGGGQGPSFITPTTGGAWQAGIFINGKPAMYKDFTLDGEMTVRLAYTDN